ncbi:MAG: hypothetical protein KGO96_07365 [Elusimicrobia bacterium]|nr:hypothetical protein [Elusimicrobiota bacterium]
MASNFLNNSFIDYLDIQSNTLLPTNDFIFKTLVNIRNNLQSQFSVLNYGAIGNNSIDETPSINKAINDISGQGGGYLLFPRGTYKISQNITFPNNVIVVFDNDALLNIQSGIQLTFNSNIIAPISNIFSFASLSTIPVIFSGNTIIYPQWFGAKGDGIANDTNAIQGTIDSASNGGTILFPSGTYLININSIIKSNIKISGSSNGGTIFKPFSTSSPVIQIGDGSTSNVSYITLENVLFESNNTGNSTGLTILSANNIFIKNCKFTNFGGDNISITASSSQPTYNIYISNVFSSYATGACLKVIFCNVSNNLSSYTSNVFLTNVFLIPNTSLTSYMLYMDTGVICTNTYFESSGVDKAGTIYIKINIYTGSVSNTSPKLYCSNCFMDENGATNNLIMLDTGSAHTIISNFIIGSLNIPGHVYWVNDNLSINTIGAGGNWLYDVPVITYPFFEGEVFFNNNSSNDESEISTASSGTTPGIGRTGLTSSSGGGGSARIYVDSAAFQCPMTYQRPMVPAVGGSIWRDSTYGQLRYTPIAAGGWFPNADSSGYAIGPRQCGKITGITGSTTTVSVTFPTPINETITEPDSNYLTIFNFTATGGSPGVINGLVTTKSTTGFTVTLSSSPGTGNTIEMDWTIFRT